MTLQTKAYLVILGAFVWLFGLISIAGMFSGAARELFIETAFLGFGLVILVGFGVWAAAKGYLPLVGIFLAFIGPLGMLVLVFLKDRNADRRAAQRLTDTAPTVHE